MKVKKNIFINLILLSTLLSFSNPIYTIDIDKHLSDESKIILITAKIYTENIKKIIIENIEKTRKYLGELLGFKEKDNFDKAIAIVAITTLGSLSIYAITKIVTENNIYRAKLKELEDQKVKQIIDSFNLYTGQYTPENIPQNLNATNVQYSKHIQAQTKNQNKKWAQWPNDIEFLSLIKIPQNLLIEKLIIEIKSAYNCKTSQNNNKINFLNEKQNYGKSTEDICEFNYAIENFNKDIDIEIQDYQKKFGIILISNFEKKNECLEKIRDYIKKLVYLKNTINTFKTKLI